MIKMQRILYMKPHLHLNSRRLLVVPQLLQLCDDHFSDPPAREHAANREGVHVAEVDGHAIPEVCEGVVLHEVHDEGTDLGGVQMRIVKPRVSRGPDGGQLPVRLS